MSMEMYKLIEMVEEDNLIILMFIGFENGHGTCKHLLESHV